MTTDRVTIKKNTDQLNYEDFLGGVTRLVTITAVEDGRKEAQYDIAIAGDDRYWRPPATVLKQLVGAWTDVRAAWVGRRALLYGDPTVKMKGKAVGGIRVSHVSHIDKPSTLPLTVTRGQSADFTLEPLTPAMVKEGLKAEWRTATPERRAEIEAEVAKLDGKQPTASTPATDPELPDPSDGNDPWAGQDGAA